MAELRFRSTVATQKAVNVSPTPSESGSDDSSVDTFTPPDLTIKDLLSAIPQHCYERSAIRSFSYIAMDLFFIAVLVYAATFIDGFFGRNGSLVAGYAGIALRYLSWSIYAFAAGLPATGLWVIAHECGHQAFSASKELNNTVGWVLHSALLVPYHSWRISHAKHHAATNHMTRDQVHVPRTRTQRGLPSEEERTKKHEESTLEKMDDLFEDAPLWTLLRLVAQQLFGWPLYIISNASGQLSYPAWTNHFQPSSIIFDKRHRQQILVSDLGIAIMFAVLTVLGQKIGTANLLRYFFAPYLWVNSHLVAITYLQHTDPAVPHYREKEWNFQRGALCTVDRNWFGFFLHGIAETHVAHHTCSKIPHYHAWEVTDALKAKLGKHYRKDDRNFVLALYDTYDKCRFVEDDGQIVFFKDRSGKAAVRVVYDQPISDSGVELPAQIED